MTTRKPATSWLWLLAFLIVSSCWSQTGTGNIQGTVKDSSGAVVPKAKLVLVHTATNRQYTTETNDVGFYLFPSIQLGDYQLTVSLAGMQTWKGQLHLLAGQTAEVDAMLTPGSTATTVEVSGEVAPIVNTTSATLATVVEPQRIQQLPVNGRDVNQLIYQTTPGALQETHGVNGVLWVPRVFGLRNASELLQDGAPLEDIAWGTEPNRPPGIDTIAELRAETNNSSAEFDRPGTFIMTTKSGTNQLHGAAFETNRDSGFGVARQRQDYYLKPPHLVRNEFGASLGGPVMLPKLYDGRNKTFFFVAYEGLRLRQNTTGSTIVPTAAMRQGDFSGLVDADGRNYTIYDPWSVKQVNPTTFTKSPFPNNQIPASLESPLAQHLYSIMPLPTLPSINPLIGQANWYGPMFNNLTQNTFTSKVDQQVSEANHLSFRYTHSPSTLLRAGNYAGSPPTLDSSANSVGDFGQNDSGVANWTHTFSPTFFSESLVTISRDFRGLEPGTGTKQISQTLGLPNPFHGIGFPRVSSGNFGFVFDSGTNPDEIYTWVHNFSQSFTKIYGRHELKFGVRLRLEKYRELEDQQVTQGQLDFTPFATALENPGAGNIYTSTPFTGSAEADFFMGADGSYVNRFNRSFYPYSNWETASYIQDNFKVSPRLTLNLGLRYEYVNPLQVTDHSMVGFDVKNKAVVLGTSLANLEKMGDVLGSVATAYQNLGVQYESAHQAGLPSSLIYKNAFNFDPRVGFAYRVTTGYRPLVLRGGYSVFQFGQPLRFSSGYGYSSIPQQGYLQVSSWDPATSPDGLPNYLLRAAPAVIAGVNSSNIINPANATGIAPGTGIVAFMDPHQPTPQAREWNLTFEKEIWSNTALSVGYVGTQGQNLGTEYNLNDQAPDYVWYATRKTPEPTGTYADVARRPYDQHVYGDMIEYQNIGWSNNQSFKVNIEHRFSKGYAFQFFYVLSHDLTAGGESWYGSFLEPSTFYMPGTVPANDHQRLRLTQYQVDPGVPKHDFVWNWVMDLPVGRNRLLGRNMNPVLDKVVGGWQLAGNGRVHSNYYQLPSYNWGPVGKVKSYGTKYPVQDCTSGSCINGYLYWNGYISPAVRNATNSAGQCIGICGVPASYQPADQPLIPWGQTAPAPNMPAGTDISQYWDSNTAWIPLNNGSTVETYFNPGMNPLQNQYILAPFTWTLNASLFKVIPIREKMSLRMNADFFSVLNNPGMPRPGDNGVIDTNVSANPARVLQLTLRLQW